MSITCTECSIRYAAELSACPWCGHASTAATVSAGPAQVLESAATSEDPEAPTHTETRSVPPPPPPPPPPPAQTQSGSVTYQLGEIPGPEEEWEPVDEWLQDSDDTEPAEVTFAQRMKRWALLGAGGIALVVFGAFLAEVIPVGVGGGGSSGSAPATAVTVPVTTLPPPVTTLPPPVTTVPPATTTAPAVTTPFIEPVGSALPEGDLTIFDTGFGELTFGSDGETALGRLAATFGQPDADSGVRSTPTALDGGFCEGDLQRVVTWGSLSAYNLVNEDGSQAFSSVSLDAANVTDPDPAEGAKTLSGLRIGDTTADLRSIYDGFRIDEPGDGVWEIRAGSDGRLLLWGVAADDGEITSIRSSRRCAG